MITIVRTLMTVFALIVPLTVHAQSAVNAVTQAALTSRIAGFSAQRAFAESADGKATIARLTALQNEKARAIDEKNRSLLAQEQALERNSSLLNESTRAQKTAEVQKFRIDVQRFVQDAQAELAGAQRDAENAFVVKLRPVLAKVAQDKGLQMVFNLDEGQVAWLDPAVDITLEVVKALAK